MAGIRHQESGIRLVSSQSEFEVFQARTMRQISEALGIDFDEIAARRFAPAFSFTAEVYKLCLKDAGWIDPAMGAWVGPRR